MFERIKEILSQQLDKARDSQVEDCVKQIGQLELENKQLRLKYNNGDIIKFKEETKLKTDENGNIFHCKDISTPEANNSMIYQ